ncbi:hypothetical protein HZU77_016420, partial [Neisseriaceae bacterium TC5R-5]|nr:hypothetical protein [Neisseriaceae bacterium TC5R-5]
GADNFMDMMCVKVNEDDVTMDGIARTTDVFVGLSNTDVLRKAIGSVATIKHAADVGAQIVVPDRAEQATEITLPPDIQERLTLYKGAFRWAIDELADKKPNRGDANAFEQVAQHFGEGIKLIGHPFNLINKMTLLIADPELDQRASFYTFTPDQADKAKQAIEQFNALKRIEERPRPAPMTEESAIVGRKIITDSAGGKSELLKIEVRAKPIETQRIVIDSIDPDAQSAFEKIAEQLGLDLDVSVPPKLAALLDNFQREEAQPRGMDSRGEKSPIVKQIIFCDILPLHNKIKRLLAKRAGVPSSAIAIITGRSNNAPDDILAVQDGFNAHGEDNRYRVVVANEKAEVGINLQIGTQALHHLTIGWTPDSLEQRNGRGVRQGNQTAHVNIYYYDADGTFDSCKRTLVNSKADWINQVLDIHGADQVAVQGGMSREQMEALIDVVGDADAMQRIQQSMAAKEAEARANSNRERQLINIDTLLKQKAFLDANPSAKEFIIRKVLSLYRFTEQALLLRQRLQNPKATATTLAKNEAVLSELTVRIDSLREQIIASARFEDHYRSGNVLSLDEVLTSIASQRKTDDEAISNLLSRRFQPTPQEDGPIVIEWQAEIDLTQSMIDEAKQNFTRQAAQTGSYPADIIEKIANGDGEMLATGQPCVVGTFVRTDKGLAVITKVSQAWRSKQWEFDSFSRTDDGSDILTDREIERGEWLYPGSAEYEACLRQAAEIEDKLTAQGQVQNGFSEVVPEVASYRQTEILVSYRTHDYLLPPPFFAYVVYPKQNATPLQQAIATEQRQVVKNFEQGACILLCRAASPSKNAPPQPAPPAI